MCSLKDWIKELHNGYPVEVEIESAVSAVCILRTIKHVWEDTLNQLKRGGTAIVSYDEVLFADNAIGYIIDYAYNNKSRSLLRELRKIANAAQEIMQFVNTDAQCLRQDEEERHSYSIQSIRADASTDANDIFYWRPPEEAFRNWIENIGIVFEDLGVTDEAPLQKAEEKQSKEEKYPAEILMLFKNDKATIAHFLEECRQSPTARCVVTLYRELQKQGRVVDILLNRGVTSLHKWLSANNAISGSNNNLSKIFRN